jgi:Xaa-Pro aminopeptidase
MPREDELAERRRAFASRLGELGMAAAVISDPRDFEYLTGVDPNRRLGPNPFTGPTGAALVATTDGTEIVVAGAPYAGEIADESGLALVEFPTFEDLEPLRPRTRLGRALRPILMELTPRDAVVGVEPSAHPEGLTTGRPDDPSWQFAEVESVIASQRAIKSESEIARIRHAVEICDHMQQVAAEAIASSAHLPDVRVSVQTALSQRGDVSSSLIEVSSRSDHRDKPLPAGSFVITDIAPRVSSYWGDSCATRPSGASAPEDPQTLAAVRAALVMGIEHARPGVRACDLDAVMRERASRGRCGSYTGVGGHGIGLDFHETPRLTPSDPTVLEPNMVLALEPGAYSHRTAVRMEAVVRLVPGGCELLSRHLGDLA